MLKLSISNYIKRFECDKIFYIYSYVYTQLSALHFLIKVRKHDLFPLRNVKLKKKAFVLRSRARKDKNSFGYRRQHH